MSEVFPQVPSGWQITGSLVDTEHPELLNSTMLSVFDSETNTVVYAGWHPEEDPTGHYVIGVLRDCELLAGPFIRQNIGDAKELVERLAWKHSGWSNLNFGDFTNFVIVMRSATDISHPAREPVNA